MDSDWVPLGDFACHRNNNHWARQRLLQYPGEDVSTEEVVRRKVPMGTHDDVVGMVFVRLFENVIHDEADEGHGFHFDSGGFQRMRK